MLDRSLSILLALLAACGCGDPSATDDAGPIFDRSAFSAAGRATQALLQSATLADSLFDFDPTLDPSMDAASNAAAIEANVEANLDGCGSVTRDGSSVTVDFGAPPGCEMLNGVTASGTVGATVSSDAASLTVTLTFTELVVDGLSLDGSATFTTDDGSTFTVTATLSSGEASMSADVTIAGAAGSFTVDGTLNATDGDGTLNVLLTGVVYEMGACYPSAGTVELTRGRTRLTVEMSEATAATGEVTVTQARRTESATLPPYGDCPSG